MIPIKMGIMMIRGMMIEGMMIEGMMIEGMMIEVIGRTIIQVEAIINMETMTIIKEGIMIK